MSQDLGFQDDFLESMLGDFLDESDGLLEQLNENLFVLDDWVKALPEGANEACDADLINEMFRAAHSLKGLSAMLRLDDINLLTHKMENVFDAVRHNELFLQVDSVDLVFRSVDCLGLMIGRLRDPSQPEVQTDGITAEIQNLLESNGAQKEIQSQADAEQVFEDAQSSADETQDAASQAENTLDEINEHVEQLQAEPTNMTDSAVANSPEAPKPVEPQVDHFAGIIDETDIPANYLSIFIDECEQSLDDLSDVLLAAKDEKTVENLMITCHKIKGGAASLGLNRPAKLAHLMEDVLQELLQAKADLPEAVADALLTCTDALRTYVETLKSGDANSEAFDQAYQALVRARTTQDEAADETQEATASAEAQESADDTLSEDDIARIVELAAEDACGFVAQVIFEPELPLVELKATLVVERVNSFGHMFHCAPAEIDFETEADFTTLTIGVATELAPEEGAAKLNLEGVSRVNVIPFGAPAEEQQTEETVDTEATQEAALATADATQATPPEIQQNKPTAESAAANTTQTSTTQTPTAQTATTTPEKTTSAATSPAPAANTTPAAAATDSSTANPTPATNAPANNSAAQIEANSAPPQKRNVAKPAETLRVDIDRLDQLMNLAGQLVINKARFVQISEGLRHLLQIKSLSQSVGGAMGLLERINGDLDSASDQSGGVWMESMANHSRQLRDDLESIEREIQKLSGVRGLVSDLSEAVHQLDRAADGIQKSVMDTRMVPIGPLFGRFKRVARDLTRGTDKQVSLEISGEKTELDKRMIDELGDPLIHMVRNSCDHGIESPADRIAAGKPAHGTVNLDAFHRGNRIVIKITDDGKGIDPAKVRDKAISRGLVTEADAERMTNQQIFQLIWEPGFSTAEKVTEVSGRGMGMDIVRSKIEELNGTVDLDSVPGKGTVFTIRLPLTMAILPTLLCRINGDVFAIPVESVIEIVRVEKAELSTVRGMQTATVRGRVVSIIALADLFTWNRPPVDDFVEPDTDDVTLVVIGIDDREVGLLVHGLIGEEDIVIKSMSENYRNVEGIAGASILGDGRVSLILDVATVLQMSCRMRSTTSIEAEVTTDAENETTVELAEERIAEDSIIEAPIAEDSATGGTNAIDPEMTPTCSA